MPDPIALAESGGWAVVVAIILGLGVGFVRGWLVPGFVYRREADRADKADAALIRALSRAKADDDRRG
jgi:hypothetical protein